MLVQKTNNEIVLVKKVVHHCKLSNLLSQMASSIRRIENFVIKYGKIERQPQSDRMRGRHFRFGYIKCLLVCLLGIFHSGCGLQRRIKKKRKKESIITKSTGSDFKIETEAKIYIIAIMVLLRLVP